MAYNIEGFKERISGIQRSSLFLVSMNLPEVMIGKNNNGAIEYQKQFSFVCKQASTPDDQIGIIEVPFMGRKIKYFGDRTYNDWSCTMLIDKDWSVYNALYNWHRAMNRQNGNYAGSFDDSYSDRQAVMNAYKVDVYINMYYASGEVSKTFRLVGAFPSNIQSIDMSWENTDTAAEVSIDFAYDYWLLENNNNVNKFGYDVMDAAIDNKGDRTGGVVQNKQQSSFMDYTANFNNRH